jgi:hypothetical protein
MRYSSFIKEEGGHRFYVLASLIDLKLFNSFKINIFFSFASPGLKTKWHSLNALGLACIIKMAHAP